MNPFVRIRSSQSLAVGVVLTIVAALGLTVPALSAQATGSCDFTPSTYATLQSDFTIRASGSVICLGANLAGNTPLEVPTGNSLTLDLNGHSLTITVGSLLGEAAIHVPASSSLAVTDQAPSGTSTLTVVGGTQGNDTAGGGAGIGGNGGSASGHITIAGGRIDATGGAATSMFSGSGAGIGGGGAGQSGVGGVGNVEITGGEVDATGGLTVIAGAGGAGAGIGGGGGGGDAASVLNPGGGGIGQASVALAFAFDNAAGSGGGATLSISGGTVSAVGGASSAGGSGAGIGGGGAGGNQIINSGGAGDISITGGNISSATGGSSSTGFQGSGIGSGGGGALTAIQSQGSLIRITGGAVVSAQGSSNSKSIGDSQPLNATPGEFLLGPSTVSARAAVATLLPAPSLQSTTFVGWAVSNPAVTLAPATTVTFPLGGARTVSVLENATVSYLPNGGVGSPPASTVYVLGSPAVAPASGSTLSKQNFVFDGWGTSPDATTAVTALSPTAHTELFAIWRQALTIAFTPGVTPATGAPVSCSFTGLAVGTGWNLTAYSTPQQMVAGTVGQSGQVGFSTGLPSGLETGLHRVVIVIGSTSYTTWFVVDRRLNILASSANPADLAALQALADAELASLQSSSTSSALAATGVPLGSVAWIAVTVLMFGATVLLSRRRTFGNTRSQRNE